PEDEKGVRSLSYKPVMCTILEREETMAREKRYREWYDEEILRREDWQRDQLDRKISELHRRYKNMHAFVMAVSGQANQFLALFAVDYDKPDAIVRVDLVDRAREPRVEEVFVKE
ncbi:unnamed protein product, partial [marine sediment metagenome]